jgi:hypothetical protein
MWSPGFKVLLLKLGQLVRRLKGAWFQVISYQLISWFQSLPFKFNLRRYALERNRHVAIAPLPPIPGGALQVESR